jgi:hypothetical protein
MTCHPSPIMKFDNFCNLPTSTSALMGLAAHVSSGLPFANSGRLCPLEISFDAVEAKITSMSTDKTASP